MFSKKLLSLHYNILSVHKFRFGMSVLKNTHQINYNFYYPGDKQKFHNSRVAGSILSSGYYVYDVFLHVLPMLAWGCPKKKRSMW